MPRWFVDALATRGAPAHPMWLYVEIGEKDECWEFFGAQKVEGYGRVFHDGKLILAHRLSYCLCNGLNLETFKKSRLLVRHTCDNPPCCNPRHLLAGTPAQNVADKMARGRANAPRGSAMSNALLTESDIPIIRQRLADGDRRRDVAADYGVSLSTIDTVKSRRTWSHVS